MIQNETLDIVSGVLFYFMLHELKLNLYAYLNFKFKSTISSFSSLYCKSHRVAHSPNCHWLPAIFLLPIGNGRGYCYHTSSLQYFLPIYLFSFSCKS